MKMGHLRASTSQKGSESTAGNPDPQPPGSRYRGLLGTREVAEGRGPFPGIAVRDSRDKHARSPLLGGVLLSRLAPSWRKSQWCFVFVLFWVFFFFFLFSGGKYGRQLNWRHDCNLISPNSELFSFQIYQDPGNVQRTGETILKSERLKRKSQGEYYYY